MELTAELITKVLETHWARQFKLPAEFEKTISNHGSDNVIFSCADGKKYVFRVIFSPLSVIHTGSQIYERLNQMGLPVPLPIKTGNGAYMVPAELGRQAGYSVHQFLEGEEERDKIDIDAVMGVMAIAFGKLHSALQQLNPENLDLGELTVEDFGVPSVGFSDALTEKVPEHPLVQEMYSFWQQWHDQIDFSSLSSGLIHGDMGPGANIMIKDGEVSGLIDMINLGMGYYMADVGSFVMYGGLYKGEREELMEEFKTNYLQHAPVSEDEFDLLPFFLLTRFLIQALYFGWRLRIGYTQGNEGEDGNEIGFNDSLWMLEFWKKKFAALMI